MKIGTNDINKISEGSSLIAVLDSYSDCLSVKQLAYRAGLVNGIKYTVSIDSTSNKVTITALKKL